MGYTLWTFLLLPDGTVNRYPRSRYDKFCDGEMPLGVAVGHEARFVELAVETRKGHPLRMLRAWFRRFDLEPSGRVSREHQERIRRAAINAIDLRISRGSEGEVVSLEPFIARQRDRREHEWHPAESQLHSVVAAINHDAAKELVTTDGEKLLPL